MLLQNLDVILIAAAGLLIVVSFIINLVSSSRLGRLSETINQLESKFESFNPKAREDKNDSRHGSSAVKMDSSVFPSQEFSPADSRMGTRYRPPGSRSRKPGEGEPADAGAASTRRIKISKSGVKLPADDAAAEPAPELPASQTPVSDASPAEPPEPQTPPMADEAKALLKEYLGRDPASAGRSDQNADLADVRDIYGKEAPPEADDIMDVVEDSGIFEDPEKKKPDDESRNA